MKYSKTIVAFLSLVFFITACDDLLEVGAPRTQLIAKTVFENDATATAALIDVYYQLSTSGFASGGPTSVSFLAGLASDELLDYSPANISATTSEFNNNTLSAANPYVANLWAQPYTAIYKVNSILDGIEKSGNLSVEIRSQLEGEARFFRAFCYFYLTAMFADVPLLLSPDYKENTKAEKVSAGLIYNQMIADLQEAERLLPPDYSVSKGLRTRVNSFCATALLARVHLYAGNWQKAEESATRIISSTDYQLESDLTRVFHKNSREAILQFEHVSGYPPDLFTFYLLGLPQNGVLRENLVSTFSAGDERRIKWIGSMSSGPLTFYYPRKYQALTSLQEFSTVLRLSEQYLIRSEARMHLGQVTGAYADLNVVRSRAKLAPATGDQQSLAVHLLEERRRELFSEWGHRWFDLVRTGSAETLLSTVKPQWKTHAVLFPIPEQQILNSPAMQHAQNPGY
ncbi:MAG TPA: RagB/SusD family nutrient uptake outer membrane protein [Chryseosolibacter sp.]